MRRRRRVVALPTFTVMSLNSKSSFSPRQQFHSVSSRRSSPDTMVFVGQVPAAAADDDDDHRFAEPPPHEDSLQVIRGALLSQLEKDRLRQEIIVAELARIESAMALRSDFSQYGSASSSADPEQQFVPHGKGTAGPVHSAGAHEARDLKREDGTAWGVQIKPEKPDMEDNLTMACSKTTCSDGKAAGQENAASDECKQESKEAALPEKTSSSSGKWSCAICQVEASSEGNLQQHFAGQRHRVTVVALKAVARAEKSRKARQYAGKPGPTWVCKFCPANCTGKSDLENHLKGKKHHAKIQALLEECKRMTRGEEAHPNPDMLARDEEQPDSVSVCGICQVNQGEPSSRQEHQMNVQALQLEAKRPRIIPPKITKKQQRPLELECTICHAKCNLESQFHDHCRSMGLQQKIDAVQREGTSIQSSDLETRKNIPSAGSDSNGASLEGETQKALYFCKLCNLQCNSKNTLAEHRLGKKHLEKVEKRMLSSFCDVCNLQCNSEKMLAQHRSGNKHQANLSGCGG